MKHQINRNRRRTVRETNTNQQTVFRILSDTVINIGHGAWARFFDLEGTVDRFIGKIWIDRHLNVLFCKVWEVHDASSFPCMKVALQEIEKLPRWSLTRWVCICTGGHAYILVDSNTGKIVSERNKESQPVRREIERRMPRRMDLQGVVRFKLVKKGTRRAAGVRGKAGKYQWLIS